MAKKHPAKQPSQAAPAEPPKGAPIHPALVRVKGSPSTPGDYRLNVIGSADKGVMPVVQTVDSVDETFLYGRPSAFWGISAFKIEKSTVEWHEKLP